MSNYSEMTIQEMLRAYNTLVADAQMAGLTHYRERRSLKDRADGLASLERIDSSLKAHREGQRRVEQTEQPPTIPAGENEQQVAETAPITEEGQMAKKAKKAAGNGSGKRGRRKTINDDLYVYKVAEGNPKREGTIGHELWGLYRDGVTVGTLREKMGKQFSNWFGWDLRHGLIEVAKEKR